MSLKRKLIIFASVISIAMAVTLATSANSPRPPFPIELKLTDLKN